MGTVSQMVQDGVPMPVLATAVAIFMELPVAFAVAVGAFTRPSAGLLVSYTLGTSLIENRYWTMKGADQLASMEGFYKNLSIMGGFLLLTLLVRKIFDRCIVQHRRAMTCVLLGRRCKLTSRKGGSIYDWVFASYRQANPSLFALRH